ncbi:MAG: CpaE family protein [Gaiellales bacterium]
MSDVRLTVAAHRSFPGNLLDGAVPNGGSGMQVASGLSDFGDAVGAAERDRSQAMLMFSPGVDEVLDVLADSRRLRPEMALIVAIPGPANGNLAEALRAGAHEIVLLPAEAPVVSDAVHKAMARASTAPVAAAPAAVMAPIVAVLGPKGGVGKTTVSTNLATVLAATGKRVLLVDLDLQFGDVGLVLGVEPERTIYDLVTAEGNLDGGKLRGYLGTSAAGVDVLLAPVRPDQAEAVTAERLGEVIDVARAEFDVVIVDTPPAFTAAAIAAVDQAAHTVIVGSLDLPGLKNMKVGIETLRLMDVNADRMTIVLNRADSKVGLNPADVKAILGRAPDINIPSDRCVPRAVNAATPIVTSEPKSRPSKALRQLGDQVAKQLFGDGEE